MSNLTQQQFDAMLSHVDGAETLANLCDALNAAWLSNDEGLKNAIDLGDLNLFSDNDPNDIEALSYSDTHVLYYTMDLMQPYFVLTERNNN